MSDTHHPAGDPATPGHPPYDCPPRQALNEMPAEVRAVWRDRYITGAEAELRVLALLDQAEATLRPGDAPAAIRTLWIALADRAGRSDNADLHAAALAGMAMGLRRPEKKQQDGIKPAHALLPGRDDQHFLDFGLPCAKQDAAPPCKSGGTFQRRQVRGDGVQQLGCTCASIAISKRHARCGYVKPQPPQVSLTSGRCGLTCL